MLIHGPDMTVIREESEGLSHELVDKFLTRLDRLNTVHLGRLEAVDVD